MHGPGASKISNLLEKSIGPLIRVAILHASVIAPIPFWSV